MANSKRRCLYCREYFDAKKMLITPAGAFCEAGHAFQWAQDNAMRKRQKALKAQDKAHKAEKRKAKANDLPHQLELTQQVINRLARLLDAGKPCISCGAIRELEAGHYRSVGSMPSLRFDLRNIHGQCRPCNGGGTLSYKRGKNPAVVRDEYEIRLRARFGDDLADWLNGPHLVKHWTCEQLRLLRADAAADCRRIERGESPLIDWRENDLRPSR